MFHLGSLTQPQGCCVARASSLLAEADLTACGDFKVLCYLSWWLQNWKRRLFWLWSGETTVCYWGGILLWSAGLRAEDVLRPPASDCKRALPRSFAWKNTCDESQRQFRDNLEKCWETTGELRDVHPPVGNHRVLASEQCSWQRIQNGNFYFYENKRQSTAATATEDVRSWSSRWGHCRGRGWHREGGSRLSAWMICMFLTSWKVNNHQPGKNK